MFQIIFLLPVIMGRAGGGRLLFDQCPLRRKRPIGALPGAKGSLLGGCRGGFGEFPGERPGEAARG